MTARIKEEILDFGGVTGFMTAHTRTAIEFSAVGSHTGASPVLATGCSFITAAESLCTKANAVNMVAFCLESLPEFSREILLARQALQAEQLHRSARRVNTVSPKCSTSPRGDTLDQRPPRE